MNAAVIGVGNMGRHHARVYTELPGVKLVAVVDSNDKIGREIAEKYGCQYYPDYEKLLKHEKVDVISVAVPTSLHKQIAIAFLERRIPVLLEKPIADTISNAREIIEVSRKNHTTLCIGHIERYNPVIQELKKLIDNHRFGDIISFGTKRLGLFPSQIKDADVIIDLAVHDIDICNFLTGRRPISVYAVAGKALNSKRIDYASIFLKYEKFSAVLQVNWITPIKIRELTVTGTNGYAEVNYLNQSIKIYKSNYEKTFDSYGDYIVKFGIPHIEEMALKTQEPLKNEIVNFLAAAVGKKSNIVTAEDGLLALEACLKARDSYQENKIKEVIGDI